jgi:hypothetical protein
VGPAKPEAISGQARWAGALYLVVIAGALFAEAGVRAQVFVRGDHTATAKLILQNASLYRLGIFVSLVYLLCNLPLIAFFYRVFKAHHSSLAALMAIIFLTSNAVEILNLQNMILPIEVLTDPGNSAAYRAQAEWIAYESLRQFNSVFAVCLFFFGFYCLLIGTLIVRSRLLPRTIGVLVFIGGIGYLVNTSAFFLAPDLASALFPFILLPAFFGELSLALWLVVFGINRRPGIAAANS